MKKRVKRLMYILGFIILLFLVYKIYSFLDQERALKQTEIYLAEHYPDLNYEIQDISISTKFGHYGYFKYAFTIENMDTKENFTVFYDKKMERMEDSIHIEEQEKWLQHDIKPKITNYVREQFGETKYISVEYDMSVGQPMIIVKFNTDSEYITQAEFDAFLLYVKDAIGLKHGTIIVDYWMKELVYQEEF